MTALAYAGIALFTVAVVVVAIGLAKQAVRYVRDVRSMIRAGTGTNLREKPLEDVLSLGEGPQPGVDPGSSKSEEAVPPGWGFR